MGSLMNQRCSFVFHPVVYSCCLFCSWCRFSSTDQSRVDAHVFPRGHQRHQRQQLFLFVCLFRFFCGKCGMKRWTEERTKEKKNKETLMTLLPFCPADFHLQGWVWPLDGGIISLTDKWAQWRNSFCNNHNSSIIIKVCGRVWIISQVSLAYVHF